MNGKKVNKIYFVGIKGVAMASLAMYYKERGMSVTGSDVRDEFPTDEELRKAKITIYEGFDATRILKIKPDLVIYTGAHGGNENPEVKEALTLGIPTMPHGKALGFEMEGKRQIVVAGSHGKTTVSAMIAMILQTSGIDPSWAVGCGGITGLGAAGHSGRGDWFVAEGDEYVTDPGHDATPRFLWLKPEILVVSNIDFDHPDVYHNLENVQDAFSALQNQQVAQKLTIVNIDDEASKPILIGPNISTYGFSPRADTHITHVGVGEGRLFFRLEQKNMTIGEFTLKVPGRHNVLNATAASLACRAVGVSWEEIRKGLLAFAGTTRRFELLGNPPAGGDGVLYYDDYAHHPREIMATLAAARGWYPTRRIIAVFQPHTYSRTKALLTDFSRSFSDANSVILTDIYASAREKDTLGITGQTLAHETAKHHASVRYAKDKEMVKELIKTYTQQGDVVIFMGAGNIYNWAHELVNSE